MLLLVHVLVLCHTLNRVPVDDQIIVFSKSDIGKLPSSWERAQTGEGQGSDWKIVADETTPSKSGAALAQTAVGPSSLFNLATLRESNFLNGTITVRLKAIQGALDQGGGIVWRYQNANNYYLCRYNPLESNFRLYQVLQGKRTQLATEEKLTFPDITWHMLSISHEGDAITCALNGKTYLKASDKSITKPGRVGLWTKADAQTRFDRLEIQSSKTK